ncbi:MAG: pyrroline-5-carboxylate reductase [Anaerovoracaceae bacterium]
MERKIVFCGGGNMAEGILGGFLKNNVAAKENITVSELIPARCDYLSSTYGVSAVSDASYAMKDAEFIVIAVLPKHLQSVTSVVKDQMGENTTILSIVAGTTLATLEDQLGKDKKIVRIMPNTLIQSGNGHSAVCFNANIDKDKKAEVLDEVLSALGQTIELPEDMFNTFTAFSCSGPLWLYKTAESLIDAGVYCGFSRPDATRMVIKNMIGVGMTLDAGADATQKINAMCSPGGVTIEGMKVLEENGLKADMMNSVIAAVKKAHQV